MTAPITMTTSPSSASATPVSLVGVLGSYLAIRRGLGLKLEREGFELEQFISFVGARGETTVTIDAALAWSHAASRPGVAARRLSLVRGFARYLAALDPATEVPPERLLAGGVVRHPPYVFSPAEIVALTHAADGLRSALAAASFRTLIGLMAATGIRTAEANRLEVSDLDLNAGTLAITYTKYGKSRLLPLHPSTVEALEMFLARRDALRPTPDTSALLLTARGEPFGRTAVAPTFRHLLGLAGISAPPGHRHPRAHDLRHTFAVTTLLGWHAEGADVAARLPLLSCYLGHVNPAHTYWYLQAVPELMTVLADRLEAHGHSHERGSR